MAAPAAVVAARVAVVLLLVPIRLPILGFGAILALFSGLSGTSQGGGPVWGGNPTTVAVAQIPPDQLALMQQVASSAPCALPWTVLAAIADVESTFGKTADQFSRKCRFLTPILTPTGRESMRQQANKRAAFDLKSDGPQRPATAKFESPLPHLEPSGEAILISKSAS